MECDNYEENGSCRYFDILVGTGEPLPSGCNGDGLCVPFDNTSEWDLIDPEDCDMLDV